MLFVFKAKNALEILHFVSWIVIENFLILLLHGNLQQPWSFDGEYWYATLSASLYKILALKSYRCILIEWINIITIHCNSLVKFFGDYHLNFSRQACKIDNKN